MKRIIWFLLLAALFIVVECYAAYDIVMEKLRRKHNEC